MDQQTQDKSLQTGQYFRRMLGLSGQQISGFESGHIMMMYFFTQGLQITGQLSQSHMNTIRQYVLSLEIPTGGFAPSSYYTKYDKQTNSFFLPHIVFTYSAINILSITGGINNINQQKCLQSIAKCSQDNGSYSNFSNSAEADLRFVYSAVTVCHSLKDFSLMDKEKVIQYIHSCRNYDGGYGLRPNCQSHSGAIYCALASLKMLQAVPASKNRTLMFLVNRQAINLQQNDIIGVQGRVGKLPDSCYSFWVGASICLLTGKNLLNPRVENFVNLCFKQKDCSFSKYPTSHSGDPVHTLHSITGIKIARNNLEDVILEKGISKRDRY